MANTSRVNGFKAFQYLDGTPYNGKVGQYYVQAADGTAIYVGDMVLLDGSGSTAGIASVTKATAAGAVIGPVVGKVIDPTNLNTPQYRAASTAAFVYVADSPDLLFEVQSSASLTATAIGLNANLVDAGGSTITGTSGETIDATSVTTTTTAQFKIVGFTQRIDNEPGTAVKLLVKVNNHQFGASTGTQGV